MVFFEFLFDDGWATRWPNWRTQTPEALASIEAPKAADDFVEHH